MKSLRYSFGLGLAAIVTSPCSSWAGPLRERFEQYPSPSTSVLHKSVGIVESIGGGLAFVVGTQISNRNSYKQYVSAYEDYQKAATAYERAGGSTVLAAAGEDGVAVLMEQPAELGKKQRATTSSKATPKPKGTETSSTTAAATVTEESIASRVAHAAEVGTEKIRGAAGRIGEAFEEKARHSEVLSRVYEVNPSGDHLSQSAANLDRARLRLKAAAERVLAQEGIQPKSAFVPLRDTVSAKSVVIPSDSVAEAKALSKKLNTRAWLARLGGLMLLGDGIYRVYLVNDNRSPTLFPLGISAYDAAVGTFD